MLVVLCPDWDILVEIQFALTHLPCIQLKCVKGHQDDKTPYAQFPLLACLNADADGLAENFQDWHCHDRPLVLLTPRTQALLHLVEGTVTFSFAAALSHAYCGPPLMEYICKQEQHGVVLEYRDTVVHSACGTGNCVVLSHVVQCYGTEVP